MVLICMVSCDTVLSVLMLKRSGQFIVKAFQFILKKIQFILKKIQSIWKKIQRWYKERKQDKETTDRSDEKAKLLPQKEEEAYQSTSESCISDSKGNQEKNGDTGDLNETKSMSPGSTSEDDGELKSHKKSSREIDGKQNKKCKFVALIFLLIIFIVKLLCGVHYLKGNSGI